MMKESTYQNDITVTNSNCVFEAKIHRIKDTNINKPCWRFYILLSAIETIARHQKSVRSRREHY